MDGGAGDLMNTLTSAYYIRKHEPCHHDKPCVYLYTMCDGSVHFGIYRSPLGGVKDCAKPVTSIEVCRDGTWHILQGCL